MVSGRCDIVYERIRYLNAHNRLLAIILLEVIMGIYLNPGNENFTSMTSREIYVDKTEMISVINHFMDTDNKYLCMSRPRRFGKTMAGNMLSSYYSKGCDSRELFLPYKIAKDPDFDDPNGKRNRQNVIKLDLNSEYQTIRDREHMIRIVEDKIKREMRTEFPEVDIPEYYSLAEALLEIYAKTKETFIIIIDEYVGREVFELLGKDIYL